MKRARVYVVERKESHQTEYWPISFGTWDLAYARNRCRSEASDWPNASFRVMAYERTDARPLLVVKGKGD